jgi:hypothetical protein
MLEIVGGVVGLAFSWSKEVSDKTESLVDRE